MGVPITFLNKYNPKQFEIIGLGVSDLGLSIGVKPYKDDCPEIIKQFKKKRTSNGSLYMVKNGEVKVPYSRILIRRKLI